MVTDQTAGSLHKLPEELVRGHCCPQGAVLGASVRVHLGALQIVYVVDLTRFHLLLRQLFEQSYIDELEDECGVGVLAVIVIYGHVWWTAFTRVSVGWVSL